MKNNFRVAVAQLNPIVGDIGGNFSLAVMAHQKAKEEGADLVLFTELFISAYPPEDLVLKPAFTKACEESVEKLAKITVGGPGIIIGLPLRRNGNIYNGLMLLDEGRVITESLKFDLPNYAEFDEKRLFSPGPRPEPIDYHGIKLGIVICEDIWNDSSLCAELCNKGAEMILVLNGSPYYRNKTLKRIEVVRAHALQFGVPIIYANQVGGQDELVFDGGSFALNGQGKMVFQMKHFESHISVSHWQRKTTGWHYVSGPNENLLTDLAADYQACVLGLKDYVNKNGFKDVILGLSGGIDSALCAAMAVDALGAERVRTIMMPYHYTSQESLKDAKECADLLGCRYEIIPIAQPVEAFLNTMAPVFLGLSSDVTEENLQSRIRGTLLMALSNKFGSMVVTTGNKSEMAVGYATLYGDMNGGFNPLKDIYKMQVYALADWRNKNYLHHLKGPEGIVIPSNIIKKAPSAELRENQKDEDSLPPYPILDDILQSLVENDMSIGDIVQRGYLRETVEKIEHLLYAAEYKRRQSAPGVKISYKNFGRDRRYPIVNHFRDKS
ncbi:NAD+ synthase [Bartonella tribocorum]|uniref:Glutamine-dependent NAD(+) synthetase n=1 Tax=Bartonella tribocorum (strain DSM 28219 / CCUG 45778 / CIP 105476 / IBS 506) TaxID=382640 RepID=A9ISS5_BART1|nr:NAD+ synthase [Bartonella tribocorum]CAK01334.1 NH3-dependent NAD synthetase [Bartonella tribocorum CIP 105476]CDO48558.1 NAD synthetase [Bartonella tribocorum]